MALSKIIAEGVDLTDTFAFTGTVTGAGDVLDATTTVPSEGGAVTTNLVQGLAKAFVSLQQTGTQAVFDSLNNSSIVDQGVGETQVNLSSAMSSIRYGTAGSVIGSGTSWEAVCFVSGSNSASVNTTSSYRMVTRDGYPSNGGVTRDMGQVSLMNTGDLA
jgi:hypothetical protein